MERSKLEYQFRFLVHFSDFFFTWRISIYNNAQLHKQTRKQRKRKTDEKSAEEPIVNIEKRSSNGRKSRKLYSGDSQNNITEEPSTSSSTNHSTAKPQNHEENDQTPTLEHTNNGKQISFVTLITIDSKDF